MLQLPVNIFWLLALNLFSIPTTIVTEETDQKQATILCHVIPAIYLWKAEFISRVVPDVFLVFGLAIDG